MDAEDTSASAGAHFLVYDPFAEAVYCRRSFAEAARAADGLGCSLVIKSEYGNGRLLAPEGVLCRYRREGQLWRIERPALGCRPGPAAP